MFSHHNQWNRSENDNFQCDICEKTFAKPSNLKRHFTVVHKMDKHVQCQEDQVSYIMTDGTE